jgi:four helix bundle protein
MTDAEQLETQHWIDVGLHCNYITQEEAKTLSEKCISVGRMIHSMIKKSEAFALNPFSDQKSNDETTRQS